MKVRHFTKFLLGLVGVMVIALGLSILTPTSAITSSYTVTDLGNLTVNAINDAGQIVGSKGSKSHAILWDKGKITNLGTLGRRYSYAYDINNKGQVVGEVKTKKGIQHAFLWQNGVMKGLGTLGGTESVAYGINNKGQVVGWANIKKPGTTSEETHAFLLNKGTMTDLGNGFAHNINNTGQVVGSTYIDKKGTRAVLWEKGTMIELAAPPSSGYSIITEAQDINNNGTVIGDLNGGKGHALLWETGTVTDLGTLGGSTSSAYSINNKGQVVGEANTSVYVRAAFLWQNGVMKDLNTLIPASSGWKLSYATDINNKGQIIGQGSYNGQSRAFLLTPTE
jgi:probable HAF family extracellular repeat protein